MSSQKRSKRISFAIFHSLSESILNKKGLGSSQQERSGAIPLVGGGVVLYKFFDLPTISILLKNLPSVSLVSLTSTLFIPTRTRG